MSAIQTKIRQEGQFLVARIPMDGGDLILGSIRASIADAHPDVFDQFTAMVSSIMICFVREAGGDVRSVSVSEADEP